MTGALTRAIRVASASTRPATRRVVLTDLNCGRPTLICFFKSSDGDISIKFWTALACACGVVFLGAAAGK